jgi:hypothetical protein
LANKVLPLFNVEAISLVIDGEIAIEDIRDMDWRLLAQSNRKPAPSQFNIEDKIINLHIEGDIETRSLLIKLSISKR